MTAPAVPLTESRTEYAVRSYGRVDPTSVTGNQDQAAYVAHALGADARVVVRKLYVSAWTDCPDGGEPS